MSDENGCTKTCNEQEFKCDSRAICILKYV